MGQLIALFPNLFRRLGGFDYKGPLDKSRHRLPQMKSFTEQFEEDFTNGRPNELIERLDSGFHERRQLALYIGLTLSQLVLTHEFFHCVLGHCSYLRILNGRGIACVLNETGRVHNPMMVTSMKYLEHAADYQASSDMIRRILQGGDFIGSSLSLPFSLKERLTIQIFASILLPLIWNMEYLKGTVDDDHPHPLIRATTFVASAIQMKGDFPEEAAILDEAVGEAFENILRLAHFFPEFDEIKFIIKNKDILSGRYNIVNEFRHLDQSIAPHQFFVDTSEFQSSPQ